MYTNRKIQGRGRLSAGEGGGLHGIGTRGYSKTAPLPYKVCVITHGSDQETKAQGRERPLAETCRGPSAGMQVWVGRSRHRRERRRGSRTGLRQVASAQHQPRPSTTLQLSAQGGRKQAPSLFHRTSPHQAQGGRKQAPSLFHRTSPHQAQGERKQAPSLFHRTSTRLFTS